MSLEVSTRHRTAILTLRRQEVQRSESANAGLKVRNLTPQRKTFRSPDYYYDLPPGTVFIGQIPASVALARDGGNGLEQGCEELDGSNDRVVSIVNNVQKIN